MRYIIIGNSAAGIGAVEGIRQVDKQGEITIITDEPHHTYSRPLISYLLKGSVTREAMAYRPMNFYEKHGCTLLSNTKATRISPTEKRVTLGDGTTIPYDKLLVATGSSPFAPPFEGLNTVQNQFTFMTLEDAENLNATLGPEKRVLIVGAGLIGLKCAEGILARVAQVTVADLAPRILSSILDDTGAKMVQDHLESKGISFLLSCGIKRLESNCAILETGEKIAFDILVLAVGVRPNVTLLQGIADIQRGIAVNAKSETTAPDIYAAGDCTQTLDISSGESKIMAVLPNAYMQGECAGVNMAGSAAAPLNEKAFTKAFPMNAIGFLGLHIITAGHYSGEEYCRQDGKNYKRLFYEKNRLNGFILIGDVQKAGIYTNLIREGTPLDAIDFPLVCQKPGLMAFSTAQRRMQLGGEAR